jgi:glycosyltransferase involved in cell wall biosynthesis
MTDAIHMASISVIIPAFKEADYIPETLKRLAAAERLFRSVADAAVQIVAADNGSTDQTSELARSAGATVVTEIEHNIARVRNTGTANALHAILIFLDADTLIPPELLVMIARLMTNPKYAGGAVDCLHQARNPLIRAHLRFWRIIGLIGKMGQGACQFCRKSVFQQLGGYDEKWYMGEDVDFFWRLKRFAQKAGLRTSYIRDPKVIPSPRRWNRWPLWRTFLWTNPLVTVAFCRLRSAWAGWYKDPPR